MGAISAVYENHQYIRTGHKVVLVYEEKEGEFHFDGHGRWSYSNSVGCENKTADN